MTFLKTLILKFYLRLRVCLFRGKIGWMKNFGEKIGRKTFLECVWLAGMKENKWWGPK